MTAPAIIDQLVERFQRGRDDYRSGRYNETQLRREFLDPFFNALGWDVNNSRGYADAYKDVIHEDAIKIGSATKAPDYCFRIGGTRKFFLEAKKPAVDIQKDPASAFQLRRYAWSAKLPLSILTDFEEFAVYDCRIRPVHSDKASTARVKLIPYTDYPARWDEIASVFSRDAVLKGSFDKYARTEKAKRGTAEVDDAFLAEIESWRDTLAHNIALRNPALDNRQLNFAVQITIDRIIFLRIAEDRGIERYGELLALVNGADIYPRLLARFRAADDRYNSGLFHFSNEKDRPEGPDELTPSLAIDDKVLKPILKSLYYPESPYEFSVLPAEILGQVYEQFLGKVITLTAGHHARVEEKPEVKKAGGVYYTPAYIVQYIVENTVGKLVEGKTPSEVAKLKILDPACGSGSFLLGAYQYLLDWHLKFYSDHDPASWLKKKNPPIVEVIFDAVGADGVRPSQCNHGASRNPDLNRGSTSVPACESSHSRESGNPLNPESQILTPFSNAPRPPATNPPLVPSSYKLTTSERKRILLNNIFGVDIDSSAVEVTKLSLLLKVLEGEKQLFLFAKERALPDLGSNIKCGNSLIAPDFYSSGQLSLFDDEEKLKINAFDWPAEFPAVFNSKNPGFDAVIGNPPWGADIDDITEYLVTHYSNSTESYRDSFKVFIEKGMSLTSKGGVFSNIVPSAMLFQSRYKDIRRFLRCNKIVILWNIGDKVFGPKVSAPCCVFVVEKNIAQDSSEVSILDTAHLFDNGERALLSHKPAYKKMPQSVYQHTTEGSFVTFYREKKDNEVLLESILDCKDCGIKHQRVGVGMEQKGKSDLASRLYYEGPIQSPKDKKFLTGSDLWRNGWYLESTEFQSTLIPPVWQSASGVLTARCSGRSIVRSSS